MCQQSVGQSFAICEICGLFAVTLIWMVLNCLQQLSYPVVSIVAVHSCMVLLTLTSQRFGGCGIGWPTWWRGLLHLLADFHCFVPLRWLTAGFGILFDINLLPYRALPEGRPVCLRSMLAASIPSHSWGSNNG